MLIMLTNGLKSRHSDYKSPWVAQCSGVHILAKRLFFVNFFFRSPLSVSGYILTIKAGQSEISCIPIRYILKTRLYNPFAFLELIVFLHGIILLERSEVLKTSIIHEMTLYWF